MKRDDAIFICHQGIERTAAKVQQGHALSAGLFACTVSALNFAVNGILAWTFLPMAIVSALALAHTVRITNDWLEAFHDWDALKTQWGQSP